MKKLIKNLGITFFTGILVLISNFLVFAEGAGKDVPNEKAAEVRTGIERIVKDEISAKGTFAVNDPRTDTTLNLSFDSVHKGVKEMPDGSYYACVDLKDKAEKVYDVDVYVLEGSGGKYQLGKKVLHKVGGEEVK